MIEADAWAVEVGADCASVLSSQGRKRKSIVKWGEKKKRLLVLSVSPAGSYRSVFKPTGLP